MYLNRNIKDNILQLLFSIDIILLTNKFSIENNIYIYKTQKILTLWFIHDTCFFTPNQYDRFVIFNLYNK